MNADTLICFFLVAYCLFAHAVEISRLKREVNALKASKQIEHEVKPR